MNLDFEQSLAIDLHRTARFDKTTLMKFGTIGKYLLAPLQERIQLAEILPNTA